MGCEFDIEREILVITPDGLLNPIDNKMAVDLAEEKILNGNNHVIINLEKIEFFSSNGLNFLLAILTKSRNNDGDTVLINISEQASKLLIVTKLKDLFTVAPSLDDAIDLLTAQA